MTVSSFLFICDPEVPRRWFVLDILRGYSTTLEEGNAVEIAVENRHGKRMPTKIRDFSGSVLPVKCPDSALLNSGQWEYCNQSNKGRDRQSGSHCEEIHSLECCKMQGVDDAPSNDFEGDEQHCCFASITAHGHERLAWIV